MKLVLSEIRPPVSPNGHAWSCGDLTEFNVNLSPLSERGAENSQGSCKCAVHLKRLNEISKCGVYYTSLFLSLGLGIFLCDVHIIQKHLGIFRKSVCKIRALLITERNLQKCLYQFISVCPLVCMSTNGRGFVKIIFFVFKGM